MYIFFWRQERDEARRGLEEALEENARLDFERARRDDGYSGPLRRMISCTSSEFLQGALEEPEKAPGSIYLISYMFVYLPAIFMNFPINFVIFLQ